MSPGKVAAGILPKLDRIGVQDRTLATDGDAQPLVGWFVDGIAQRLTDAVDGGDEQGWEQVAWIAAHNSRVALTEALSGMIRDGEITRARAEQLARMVMRENAVTAYHLGAK